MSHVVGTPTAPVFDTKAINPTIRKIVVWGSALVVLAFGIKLFRGK